MSSPILETAPSTCDKCGASPIIKQMIGVEWNRKIKRSTIFYGNSFCCKCLEEIKNDVEEYRPSPGYSKPPAFIVARQKEHSSVTGKDAITLAIAYGNWLKAAQIAKIALVKRKRFFPSELRCNNRYVYRRPPALSQPVSQQSIAQQSPPQQSLALQSLAQQPQPPTAIPRRMKIICSLCGAKCHMNKNGHLRAHRNENDRTKLCTGP